MTQRSEDNSHQEQPNRPFLGLLLALAAVSIWGSTAVIGRHLALQGVSMQVVAFLRVAIGGGALGVFLVSSSQPSRKDIFGLIRNRWVLLALLCYGGNMFVYHTALRHTSASIVSLLQNTSPVIALFGGVYLFAEGITARKIAALILALSGAVLVCGANPGISATAPGASVAFGGFLGVLTGVTWGGYTLACRGLGLSCSGKTNGMLAMCVMLLGSGVLLLPTLPSLQSWPSSAGAWFWITTMALLHTALATVLWRLALTHIRAYNASLLFLLTIPLTMLYAVLFLNESLTPLMLVGAFTIIAAMLTLMGSPARKTALLTTK